MDKDFKLCPEDCRPALIWEDSCRLCTRGTPFKATIAKFKDYYEPEPKKIPVEVVATGHSHPYLFHITDALYNAIKQLHPDGIEVP